MAKVRKGIIYLIRNMVNGKGYVGQSILTKNKRWSLHKSEARRSDFPFCRAIRKYGAENFSMEVLIVADPDELDDLEQKFIRDLNTHVDNGCGYNSDGGGRGNRGFFSEETRRKMAAIQKALWDSLDRRIDWAIAMTNLHLANPGIRVAQSIIRNAYLAAHPEVPGNHSKHMKELNALRPEIGLNQSLLMEKHWQDKKFRDMMRARQRDAHDADPERARAQSDYMTDRWQRDEGFRLDMSKKHTKRYTNQAERRKTGTACQASRLVHNATGYRGVFAHGSGWGARIKCCRTTYHLGTYRTPEEAALAYNKKAIELFGPDAFQNKIRRNRRNRC